MTRPIITAEEFIEQAIEALGGRDSLYNVSSIYIQLERCIWMMDAEPATLRIDIYRAQGGRIRQEEYTNDHARTVTILNGLSGSRRQEQAEKRTAEKSAADEALNFKLIEQRDLDALEVEQIKRGVRLYPRNFLAHADEHPFKFSGLQQPTTGLPAQASELPAAPGTQPDSPQVYLLDLLVEDVSYHFDANTLQCLRMIDRRNDCVTNYEDYQRINNILAPMIERTTQAGRNFCVDTIRSISYNLPLDDTLFHVD